MNHEGPRPSRKDQKRSTAAERVTQLHDEYEARGKPSSDKLLSVVTHNEKYPKLRNELSKRRSVANVSDVGRTRKRHASRSTNRAAQSKRGRCDKLTGVTKRRSRKANCTNLPTKIFGTKSCQFSARILVIDRRIGTDATAIAEDEIVAPTVVVSETIVGPEPPKESKPAGSSVGSIGSGIASVSSFNSNYSMDQEPMDRKS